VRQLERQARVGALGVVDDQRVLPYLGHIDDLKPAIGASITSTQVRVRSRTRRPRPGRLRSRGARVPRRRFYWRALTLRAPVSQTLMLPSGWRKVVDDRQVPVSRVRARLNFPVKVSDEMTSVSPLREES
jgi:hypothetical protein